MREVMLDTDLLVRTVSQEAQVNSLLPPMCSRNILPIFPYSV